MSRDTFPAPSTTRASTALSEFASVFIRAPELLRSSLDLIPASVVLGATTDPLANPDLDLEVVVVLRKRAPFFQLGLFGPWLLSVLRGGIAFPRRLSFA
jgi:hypothetical protein